MTKTTSIWFHTFGCKANQYDTERMRQELEGRGAFAVEDVDAADVAILNTCTVTNQADANARHLARRLRRRYPDLRIVLAGCATSFRKDGFRAMDEADAVVPGHDPARVADEVPGLVGTEAMDGPLERNARGTRAWLKIQDGCDRKCSFCATRIARGVSRSRTLAAILEEARILARHHPEIVLTGIHIGHYGRDLDGSETLARLCAQLLEAVPVRIRLTSIEATEIDDDLVDVLTSSGGQLAPHLHVPMQSGSDRILRLMRRWHTRSDYRRRVLEIAERVAHPFGLGADIIVGFPGEGDGEMAETRELVEQLPFTYLHVFPYSVRDATVAASLPDRVPGDVAAKRGRELRELALAKGDAYRASRAGGVADVIVEGTKGKLSGMTEDYLRVEVSGDVTPGERAAAALYLHEGRLQATFSPEFAPSLVPSRNDSRARERFPAVHDYDGARHPVASR